MSNPTFVQGPITFPAGEKLEKFTLVQLTAEGTVIPAQADSNVIGAVTEEADPNVSTKPTNVAVHYGVAAVKLKLPDSTGRPVAPIKAGAAIYAGANGRVAPIGSVQVGVAVRDTEDGKVLTVLNGLPATKPASA